MSLIPCLDCGRDVSSLAPACIHCGRPAPAREPAPAMALARTAACPVCGMDVTHPHARTGGAAWCEQCGTKLIFGTDGALVRVLPRAPEPRQPRPVVLVERKSVGLAALLTFLFGPLGMLYSTVSGAAIMFFVTIATMILTLGLGLFIVWPVGVVWAAHAAAEHNRRLATYAAYTAG